MVQYICIYVVIVIRVSKRNSLNSLTGEVSSDGSKIFQTGDPQGGNQFGAKIFGKILAENWIKNERNWTEWAGRRGYMSLVSCTSGKHSPYYKICN